MKKPLIYIVEDDVDFAEMVQAHLDKHQLDNYKVYLRGEECLKDLEALNDHPNYVFLDFQMPGLNGLDTLKFIHRLHRRAKIIIVTALDDKELKQKCLKAGAIEYFSKTDKDLASFWDYIALIANKTETHNRIMKVLKIGTFLLAITAIILWIFFGM